RSRSRTRANDRSAPRRPGRYREEWRWRRRSGSRGWSARPSSRSQSPGRPRPFPCTSRGTYRSAKAAERDRRPASKPRDTKARSARRPRSRAETDRACASSSFSDLALEDIEAVSLGGDEVLVRERGVIARTRCIERHEVGHLSWPAGQQQNSVGQVDRLLEVVRYQNGGGAGLHEDALQLPAHEKRHF